jgi:hypothetical protein
MRISAVLIFLGLSIPTVAQANVIAFQEEFHVRFDSFHAYPHYGSIVDHANGEEISSATLVDRYGIGWYTGGFELGEYRTGRLTIESENGSLAEDKITRVSFSVEGCGNCGAYVNLRPESYGYYQSEIKVGSNHRDDGSVISLLAAVDSIGWSSNFSVSWSEAGSGGASVEQVDDRPSSLVPYDPETGYLFSIPYWDAHLGLSFHDKLPEDLIVTPLPASVLFLLAGVGGLGVIARHKRQA